MDLDNLSNIIDKCTKAVENKEGKSGFYRILIERELNPNFNKEIKRMIKAVVFDFDGTLHNRKASVVSFIENQFERLLAYLSYIPKEEYVKRFIELDNDVTYGKIKSTAK